MYESMHVCKYCYFLWESADKARSCEKDCEAVDTIKDMRGEYGAAQEEAEEYDEE